MILLWFCLGLLVGKYGFDLLDTICTHIKNRFILKNEKINLDITKIIAQESEWILQPEEQVINIQINEEDM